MGWELASVQKSDQHATHVRIEDWHPDSVPECEQCAGGVSADARQQSQFLHGEGDLAVVLLDNRRGAGLEAQGA